MSLSSYTLENIAALDPLGLALDRHLCTPPSPQLGIRVGIAGKVTTALVVAVGAVARARKREKGLLALTVVKPHIEDRDLVLKFFFHARGAELQRIPLGLFRSLLHQVLNEVPDALQDLVARYRQRCDDVGEKGGKLQWELHELQHFFELSLRKVLKSRHIWLFVDALDECGAKSAVDLIQVFESLLQRLEATGGLFRICFTCRHYPIPDLNLDLDYRFEICLELENEKDISTYVRAQLAKFNVRLSSKISDLITTRASGVFLWAHLVVKRVLELEQRKAPFKEMEEAVYAIPGDLDKLYMNLVRGMDDRPASLTLIQWICFATRPLSLNELRCALAVDIDFPHKSLQDYQIEADYEPDDMMERIKTLSCGLAEAIPSSNTHVVQFIHQSVKDFFVEKGLSALGESNKWIVQSIHQSVKDVFVGRGLDGSPSIRISTALIGLVAAFLYLSYSARGSQSFLSGHALPFPIVLAILASRLHGVSVKNAKTNFTVEIAHYRLSRACIRYLAMEKIAHSTTSNAQRLEAAFPLLRYATTSWIAHVKQSETKISQENLLDDFEWPSEHVVETWVLIYRKLERYSSDCPPERISLLHIVSRYQLMGLLRIILRRAHQSATDINPKNRQRRTPLLYAAERGHEAVVQELLLKKADVNVRDISGATALHWAATRGHEEVISLLLKNAANIEATDQAEGTPLAWAIESGQDRSVRMLLEKSARVNCWYKLVSHLKCEDGKYSTCAEPAELDG
ncbi:hypothetical protein HIM_09518 [Hirsutella minnesotensis 3608]|uniref:Uncharacterized protein n=1 Tax=Hirsutella minnesotensis 3608 TaxID=1043627 RepID=A0A0F8A327_9HYPO|nr:hypothetical protein HIM_09518 [Hirsutella minnesotensis 3608]